jgi:flagellar biosynthesis protein FliQ
MDFSNFVNALNFVIALSLPLIAGILGGALVMGVLQAATQVSDGAIGFVGRIVGFALALYLFGAGLSNQLLDYSSRIWGGADFYRW